MTEQPHAEQSVEAPLTMDELLKAYAVSLQAYEDADKAFRAEPTALNVSTMHRWLDRLVCLRNEIGRAAKMSDAITGSRVEPEIREMLAKVSAAKGQ